jgi:anti-sigma factor RsiW
MECTHVRELLPDYSVDLVGGRQRREMAAHLEICADCAGELRALNEAMTLVERYGALEPPAGLFNAVRNRIESGEVVRERPAWWFWFNTRPARGLAMGLAMGAVALGLLMPVQTLKTGNPLPMANTYRGGAVASGELANSIRQHAMSAAEGPLADRVAWEAMAQIAGQNRRP